MMKKWQIIAGTAASVLLISVNSYLLLKKDSEIDRISYVSQYEETKRGDLQEAFHTEGVVVPLEEHKVYFNEQIGAFSQFTVAEGDTVNPGDPLFEYESFNIEEDQRMLEFEADKLEEQIESIEDHIDELRSFIIVIEAKESTENADEDSTNFIYNSVVDVEKEIYQKELERELLMAEASVIQKQISNIDQQNNMLTTLSTYAGTVTDINTSLGNPVITIHSDTPSIKGSLTEEDVDKIEVGMPAHVFAADEGKINGLVSKINTYPEAEPSLNKESSYPFSVELQLEEEQESLLTGKHVNVNVVTNEILDAVTIPVKALSTTGIAKNAFVIGQDGTLQKTPLTVGLKMGQTQEVVEGLSSEQLVAIQPDIHSENDITSFNTPIWTKYTSKTAIENLGTKQIAKYIFTGFIQR